MSTNENKAFNILSLDGGGIRGIFTARLIQRITEYFPEFLARTAACAGTSTGGILSLGIAKGLGPGALVDLYAKNGKRIFNSNFAYYLGWGAKYGNKGLRTVLEEVFGKMKLSELQKFVLIPSFDLDRPARLGYPRMMDAKFWSNSPRPGNDGDELVVDVALRTSAAPTYFPAYKGHIDGGVVVNNPAACAVAEARSHGQYNLKVLSIGTGLYPSFMEDEKSKDGTMHNNGLVKWAPRMIPLMMDGVTGVDDFQCRQDLGTGRYLRLNGVFDRNVDLDDVKAVDDLLKYADAVDLAPVIGWLKTHW